MPSTVDEPASKVLPETSVLPSFADDDALATTRMPTIQPPPLPPFSPQQIFASLHTDPAPATRSTSWNTKPGNWWPSLTSLVQRKTRPASVIVPRTPRNWTQERVGLLASIAGVAIVVVALLGAYLDLAFPSSAGGREGLAIAVVGGRVVIALAFATFGWGLVRLGERLSVR